MNLEDKIIAGLGSATSRIPVPPPPAVGDVIRRGGRRRMMRFGVAGILSIGILVSTTILAIGSEPDPSYPAAPGSSCPVTIPGEVGFVPPEPYPPTPNAPNHVWYGSDGLWTTLNADGSSDFRKSVWWSANFPGGLEEERPAISVTYQRLDGDQEVVVSASPGDNAYTPEEGWFMFADIKSLTTPGCWEVTASYKGESLSYVWELP